jgi:hypothetical protein
MNLYEDNSSLKVPLPSGVIILGWGHRARQGKDTVCAEILTQRSDRFDVRKYAFGDEVKREVEAIGAEKIALQYGIPLDPNPDMSDPLCPSGKQSRVLQFWGTDVRRAQDPWYWLRKVAQRIEAEKPQIALISDVRFLNETFFPKACGGYVVKVSRKGFLDPSRDPNHPSEAELDNFDGWDFIIEAEEGDLPGLKADGLWIFDTVVQAQILPEFVGDEFDVESFAA